MINLNSNLSNQVENGVCILPRIKQNGNQKPNAAKVDRSAYRQLEAKYEKTQKLLDIANSKLNQSLSLAEQPTSTILSKTLESSKVIELRLTNFQTQLNDILIRTKDIAEKSSVSTADHKVHGLELVTEHNIYEKKLNEYRDILPLFMETLKDLESQMTSATRITFTDIQLAAFSSKQSRPLEDIKSNDSQFDKQLKACDDLFNKLSYDLKVIGETLNFIKIDLDTIDHNVGYFTKGTTGTYRICDYKENKSRLSPLDKNFSFEKTKEAVDVVAIAI